MKIISEEELATRLDFRAPLNPPPEEESTWCIPFEYGSSNAKGTRISISKAKEIAAELRAAVAEAEGRYLLRCFKREQERSKTIGEQYRAEADKNAKLAAQLAEMKRTHVRRKTR